MPRSLSRRSRIAAVALTLGSALALSACATPTPYKAATGTNSARTGFWDEQIESNRFRVSFAGNSLTSRETVERYLLYRAAQLTLERGGDHFLLADRDTEKKTDTYVTEPLRAGPWGGWGPSWRYYSPRWGWRGYSPWMGDPFWDRRVDVQTVNRYEATAEIIVGSGPKPDNVRAFNAREVVENLGPSVTMPQQK